MSPSTIHTVMNTDTHFQFEHTEQCAEEQIFHPLRGEKKKNESKD